MVAVHPRRNNQLFGREQEEQQLLNAFRQAVAKRPGVCLVEGMAGVGKSALLAACRRSLVEQGVLCLRGVFTPPQTTPSLHGLALLLEDLCMQLLSRPNWHASPQKQALQIALGPYSALFVDLAPSAVRLFGPQVPPQPLAPNESRNQVVLLFRKVITATATIQHPMVWFLDDCQWCDPASAEVVRRLLMDTSLRHWCIIGAQRVLNHELPQRLFQHAINAARHDGAPLTRLSIEPLSVTAASDLIGARLGADSTELGNLPDLLYQQAMGHPLYTIQSLESLLSAGKLRRGQDGMWRAPADAIRQLPHNLAPEPNEMTAELLQQRVNLLDAPVRELLGQASYLGDPFSASLLAAVMGQRDEVTAEHLAAAAASGFLGMTSAIIESEEEPARQHSANVWQFAHEEVRKAVQSVLPEAMRRRLRQQVGMTILLNLPRQTDDEQIYLAAHYLNDTLETDRHRSVQVAPADLEPNETIRRLVVINHRAGVQALRRLDAMTALQLAKMGAAWLAELGEPWLSEPSLARDLASLRLQAAYFLGVQEETEQAASVLLPQIKDAAALGSIYVTLMMAATAREDTNGVDTLLYQGLATLNISFPKHLNRLHLFWLFLRCRWRLRSVSKDPGSQAELLAKSSSKDLRYVAASRILMSAFLSKQARGEMEFLLYSALLGVEWTIVKGHTPLTVIGFILYTVMLSRTGSAQDELQRYTTLTQKLLERLTEQQSRAAVIVMFNILLIHRLQPLQATVAPLRSAIELALADGDGQFAADCALVYLLHLQLANVPAAEILAEGDAVIARLAICGESIGLRYCRFVVENWRAVTQTIDVQAGLTAEETLLLEHVKLTNNHTGLFIVHSNLLFRQLLAEDFAAARASAEELRRVQDAIYPGSASEVAFLFGDSLTQLLDLSDEPKERRSQLQRVNGNQRKLERWAAISPRNYRYRWLMIEAQRQSMLGSPQAAAAAFTEAWQCASAEGFWFDAAGIAELAGLHYLRSGDFYQAQVHLERACATYARWGSPAKVRILERLFSFAPYTVKEVQKNGSARAGLSETLHRLHQSSSLQEALQHTLAALASAVGANRVVLLAGSRPDEVKILGCQTVEATVTWPDGLSLATGAANVQVPLLMVTYVLQSQRPLVVDDPMQHSFLAAEQGLAARRVDACWCLPVRIQSRVAGLIYVEDPTVDYDPASHENSSELIAAGTLLLWENEQLHTRLLANPAPMSDQHAAQANRPEALAMELLGKCRIVHAGKEVTPLLQERMQVLVALLALSRDAVPRSQLGTALWPEASAEQSQTNLRNLTFKLRQAWPSCADLIDFDRKTLSWKTGTMIETDVTIFQRAAEAGLTSSGLIAQRALEQALELYRGDLLPGVDMDVLAARRMQLHEEYLRILDRLVELHVERNEFVPALRYAQQLLAADPLRETSYRHVMRLHALAGDPASARRTYEACVTMLHNEFGAPPSALTDAVFAQYIEIESESPQYVSAPPITS